MVLLPVQQVQTAAVTRLHADAAVGTQHLAWGAVTAGLAAPNAVLGDREERARVSGKREPQEDCCGMAGGAWEPR